MADQRRLRSVLAPGRGAPTRSLWHRSARGLPCDCSRRRLPRNPTILRCTLYFWRIIFLYRRIAIHGGLSDFPPFRELLIRPSL